MKKISWIGILSLFLLSNSIFGYSHRSIHTSIAAKSDTAKIKGWRKTHHGIKSAVAPGNQTAASVKQPLGTTTQPVAKTGQPVRPLTPAIIAKRKFLANKDTVKN